MWVRAWLGTHKSWMRGEGSVILHDERTIVDPVYLGFVGRKPSSHVRSGWKRRITISEPVIDSLVPPFESTKSHHHEHHVQSSILAPQKRF